MYNYWLSQGWAPHQAAGVVGNLHVESFGLNNEHIYGGYKNEAFGIGQWLGSRRRNLFAYAETKGTLARDARGRPVTDLQTQLEFQQFELTKGHKYEDTASRRYAERLRDAQDVVQATQAFTGVERPNSRGPDGRYTAPYNPDRPELTHHYDRRLAAAERASRRYPRSR